LLRYVRNRTLDLRHWRRLEKEMKRILGTVLALGLASAASVAGASDRYYDNGRYYSGYDGRNSDCRYDDRGNAVAPVVGALIGGAIGNQVGHGRDRAAATAAGAIIGGAIAASVDDNGNCRRTSRYDRRDRYDRYGRYDRYDRRSAYRDRYRDDGYYSRNYDSGYYGGGYSNSGYYDNGYYGGSRSGVTIRIGSGDPYYGGYDSRYSSRGYYDRYGRYHYYRR
jgi:hypothetical protein